jgi:hypothetical protein
MIRAATFVLTVALLASRATGARAQAWIDVTRNEYGITTIGGNPDLVTVYAEWLHDLGAEVCPGSSTAYVLEAIGPYYDEEHGTNPNMTSAVGFHVRRDNTGISTLTQIFRYCQRCSAVYEPIVEYDQGLGWVMFHYDSVNQRWGWYLQSRGGWVYSATAAQAHLRAANRLRVGAQSDNVDSELGPFSHDLVHAGRGSSGWSPFSPTPPQDAFQIWHVWDRYLSTYLSDGTVQIMSFGPNCS